jgi:hypothetical protein
MIEEKINNNNNSIATVAKSDYLTLLTKKRKTRWDDNYKPCKNKKTIIIIY